MDHVYEKEFMKSMDSCARKIIKLQNECYKEGSYPFMIAMCAVLGGMVSTQSQLLGMTEDEMIGLLGETVCEFADNPICNPILNDVN